MNKKKTILVFIGYYLPGYKGGGSLRTIANMVECLGDEFNFKIITRDRDWGDEKPYPNVKVNEWNGGNKCKIYFVDNKTKLTNVIKDCDFDTYYLNSFFDFNFSIRIILLRKLRQIKNKQIILAPRGEFMKGALSIKGMKKFLFMGIAKIFNLYGGVIWHASTENEALEIKREMGEQIQYKTALDIPDYDLLEKKVQKQKSNDVECLNILYLSSIVPKKNLKFAIQILNRINGNFTFDIYGSIINKNYWNECIQVLSPTIEDKIKYKGEITNKDLHILFSKYDILFLPTLGENFGHVIWESLALDCKVLTTVKTPWNNLEKFNLGWNISLINFDDFLAKINDIIQNNKEMLFFKKSNFKEYLNKYMNKEELLNNNKNLFNG